MLPVALRSLGAAIAAALAVLLLCSGLILVKGETDNGAVVGAGRCLFDEVQAAHLRSTGSKLSVATEVPRERSLSSVVRGLQLSSSGPLSGSVAQARTSKGAWQPIRIGIFTGDIDDPSRYCTKAGERRSTLIDPTSTAVCTDEDVLTPEKREILLRELLPAAVQLHSERLLVQRVGGNVKVGEMTGDRCAHFTVPSSHQESGVVGVDFVLYVAAAPTSGNTIAWALTCQQLSGDGRPVVGVANISPHAIRSSTQIVRVVAHEVLHALGFSAYVFSRRGMVVQVGGVRGKLEAPAVQSPRVVAAARAHYGCDSLSFVELEDVGGAGTAGSHWKRRNAKNDLMAAVVDTYYYTAMDIAAMEDTGYYKGNYSKAELMPWGFQGGCSLISEKCIEKDVSQQPSMFCTDETVVAPYATCTFDRMSLGYCMSTFMWEYKPERFRYFTNVSRTGDDPLMDYCPYVSDKAGNLGCTNGDAVLMPGSVISTTSRCLRSSTGVDADGYQGLPAVCAEVQCDERTRTYNIRVSGATNFTACPPGSSIAVAELNSTVFSNGAIDCPVYAELCTEYTNETYDSEFPILDSSSGVPAAAAVFLLTVFAQLIMFVL